MQQQPQNLNICLAQTPVVKGDIDKNVELHLSAIEQAARSHADVIVFPELSLTGYELELAKELALEQDNSEFKALSSAAMKHQVVIIAGCPLKQQGTDKPGIGAAVCFPDGQITFYLKQYLHQGEEVYCSAGGDDFVLELKGRKLGIAICADFTHEEHVARLVDKGIDAYVVSALISESGFDADEKILVEMATNYARPVLLSNHISVTGGWISAGKSSHWDKSGRLVKSADTKCTENLVCHLSV